MPIPKKKKYPSKTPSKTPASMFTEEEPTYKERVRLRKAAELAALPPALKVIAKQTEILTELFHFEEE